MSERFSGVRKRVRDMLLALREVNGLIFEADKILMCVVLAETIVHSFVMLATFLGAGVFLSQVGQLTPTLTIIILVAAYYLISEVLTASVGAFKEKRLYIFNRRIGDVIDKRSVETMAKLDIGRLQDPHFLQTRLLAGRRGESAPLRVWQFETMLIGSLFGFVVGIATLMWMNLLIVIPVFFVACSQVVYQWIAQAYMRKVEEDEAFARRRQNQMLWEMTSWEFGFQMHLMGYMPLLTVRYFERTLEIYHNAVRVARYKFRWSTIVGSVVVIGHGLFWGIFGYDVLGGAYTLLQIGAVLGGFHLVSNATRDFGVSIAQLDHSTRDYGYLAEFHRTTPMLDESVANAITLEKTPVLEVSKVTFVYPGSSQEALRGCSLRIDPSEKIAFVGQNGSGKTTFAQLISKVYVSTGGDVLVDGTSISSITQKSWIEQLLYVKPPTRVPELTLREALTAVDAKEVDDMRLQKALVYAGARAIVDDLPSGLDTQLGRQWPEGRDFSSGQYQRLALVLAFYRLLHPSVRVAIFDESMAHCDIETKDRFYPIVAGTAGDFAEKTIITILHDQQFLHLFNRIVEFDGGLIKRDLKAQLLPAPV